MRNGPRNVKCGPWRGFVAMRVCYGAPRFVTPSGLNSVPFIYWNVASIRRDAEKLSMRPGEYTWMRADKFDADAAERWWGRG